MTVPSEDASALAARPHVAGVTVVTTRSAGDVFGLTVSGYTAVSVSPLLVVASIGKDGPLLGMVRKSRVFALSILASHQQAVAAHFASSGSRAEAGGFARVAATAKHTGSPVVHGCLSWFDCEVDAVLPGEDHDLLVGRVVAAGSGAGEPLISFGGGFASLDDVLMGDASTSGASTSGAARSGASTSGASTSGAATSGASAAAPASRRSDLLAADALGWALHLLGPEPTDLCDARHSVAAALAALAARRGSAQHWDAMEAIVDHAQDAAQVASLSAEESAVLERALGDAVDDVLAAAAANRVLAITHQSLRRALGARGDADNDLGEAVARCRGLLKAMRAGDAAAAAALMR